MTDRITNRDLEGMLGRYVRALESFDMIPAGYHIGLDHGSTLYGRAFRVYLTGDRVPVDGVNTFPNGSGHHNPPAGDDFLGMTKREAYNALADRSRVLEDVAYAQERADA